MVKLTETATLLEVIWTIVALPGLLLWIANLHTAYGTIRLAKKYGVLEDRMLWARFSLLLTSVFVSVEAMFVFIGTVSMFRIQAPDSQPVTAWILGGGLTLASLLISFVGYRWRVVDRQLVALARVRKTVTGR